MEKGRVGRSELIVRWRPSLRVCRFMRGDCTPAHFYKILSSPHAILGFSDLDRLPRG